MARRRELLPDVQVTPKNGCSIRTATASARGAATDTDGTSATTANYAYLHDVAYHIR